MKWKTPTTPKVGETKYDIRFAFLPTRTEDGYTVWLETYRVLMRYETRPVPTKFGIVEKTDWFVLRKEPLWHLA